MKTNWKTKKLGDIITPAKVVKNGNNNDFPILSITMHNGIVLQSSRFKKTIASVDTSGYKVVKNGQLVIAFPIDEGLIYTQDIVDVGIMSPAYNIWDVDFSEIDRKFLVLYLHSPFAMAYYKGKLRGTTMRRRSIPKEDLLNMPLPVPPLSTQLSIVSELDKINELIRLKKEQLKDYDNLAQSIFYEMFGDPAVNDKNWKVMKLGEICRNCDNLRKPITASDRIPGSIPYYGASGIVDYVEDYIFSSDYLLVSEDGANLLARTTPIAFSISGKTWVNNHAHVLEFKDSETQLYVEYLINSVDISNYITGAVQPKLNQAKLNVFPIPLPPHSLQQLFAQRIELIEQQKAAIQSAIADLETLLASRMQYWFD